MSANIKELLNNAKPTERIIEPMGWLGINTVFWSIPRNGQLMSVMFASYTEESQQCYISVERLAATMRCSEVAIKKGRKQLVEDGWIKKIGIHENKCAIYIMTAKARKLLEDDYKAIDAIHQHNKDVAENRRKAVAEEYQCEIAELSFRKNKQNKDFKANTVSDVPNSTTYKTNTVEIPVPVHQHEEAVHETATAPVAETVAVVAENVNVDLSNDKNYIMAKKYEAVTKAFFSRYDNSRREWTIEEVTEFFNLQPYNWKYADFDTNKAYIKNFKGVKLNKIEFERKMLTILNTSSIKKEPVKFDSNGLPANIVIPDKPEKPVSKESLDRFLDFLGRDSAMVKRFLASRAAV